VGTNEREDDSEQEEGAPMRSLAAYALGTRG